MVEVVGTTVVVVTATGTVVVPVVDVEVVVGALKVVVVLVVVEEELELEESEDGASVLARRARRDFSSLSWQPDAVTAAARQIIPIREVTLMPAILSPGYRRP